MSKPRLLDLFCGAGGAGKGYHNAGFDVVGVDINPQKNYPFEFHQGDALHYALGHWNEYDVIHASPPCQSYLRGTLGARASEYADLVSETRALLELTRLPYVIENVMGAPLLKEQSIVLCGNMFGLRTYRHRRFESNVGCTAPAHPKHVVRTATRRRKERWALGWNVSVTGDVGVYVGPAAMGIDWMTGNELSESIPPAYTEHIGGQLLAAIQEAAA